VAVKIYFCDICNESIPLQDLEAGKAITVKGKVLCRNCNPGAGSAASPPAAAAAQPARYALLAILLSLAGAGAMGVVLRNERDEKLSQIREEIGEGERRLRAENERRGETLLARHGRGEEALSRLSQGTEETTRRIDRQLQEMGTRLEGFQAYIRETEEGKRRLEGIEIAQTAASENLRSLQAAVEELRRTVEGLRAGGVAAAPPSPAPADGPSAQGEGAPEAIPPGIQSLLVKLKDPDPSVRWGVVTDLAKAGDPRVVPHLLPLLEDEDSFVRHNVALTLGELDARSAVPALLDALSDEQAIVRDSAITALRRLTHQNLKFDPYARREERDRQLRAWRSWWDSNGARFLEGK
jgi:hypothetical protein